MLDAPPLLVSIHALTFCCQRTTIKYTEKLLRAKSRHYSQARFDCEEDALTVWTLTPCHPSLHSVILGATKDLVSPRQTLRCAQDDRQERQDDRAGKEKYNAL